ncbi:MAG: glycosyltransferase [Ahrensia sp.]|nr:glycosyltransferase [Ahrensia sp.]
MAEPIAGARDAAGPTADTLTVIIPSYNMQDMTQRAVSSVRANSETVRIIIIDDASQPPLKLPRDMTEHPRTCVIRHEENRGASAARNTGVVHAETAWLSFLDADDVWLPDTLTARLHYVDACIAEHRLNAGTLATSLFSCGWLERDRNGELRARIPGAASTLDAFASGCWYCPGSTLIAHSSVYRDDAMRFDENLPRLEDFEWGLRFGKRGGRLFVADKATVRIDPANRTSLARIDEAAEAIRAHHGELEIAQPQAWRRMNAYLQLERVAAAWRDGQYSSALAAIMLSYLWKPRIRRHFSPGWTFRSPSAS